MGPLFDHFYNTQEAKREFLLGMQGFGLLSSAQVVAACGLTPYQHLVDLGGATGHPATARHRHASLRAAVFDLPEVIEITREYVDRSGLAARFHLVPRAFSFEIRFPTRTFFPSAASCTTGQKKKIRLILQKVCEALPGARRAVNR